MRLSQIFLITFKYNYFKIPNGKHVDDIYVNNFPSKLFYLNFNPLEMVPFIHSFIHSFIQSFIHSFLGLYIYLVQNYVQVKYCFTSYSTETYLFHNKLV